MSGKEEADYVTLCGIAATDTAWDEIEPTWDYCLEQGTPPGVPRATYMHMNEAVFLKRGFDSAKGWDAKKVFDLANYLLSYITTIPPETYCQFACTVDMKAYRKLQAESYQMDSVADICNSWCTEVVMHWYVFEYKGVDFEAAYYFDQGEPFEPSFKAKWIRETRRERYTGNLALWSHIKCISTADMRTTPGLQIADMFAWGRNREETKPPNFKEFEPIGLALRRLAPSKVIVWDEALLKKHYRPLIYKPYEQY